MHYLAILIAFLCETTVYPKFIKTSIHIESITITYFIIILATQKRMPVLYPTILLFISSILTAKIAGLNSLLLLVGAVFHNRFFLARERSKPFIAKPNQSSAIAMFCIIFLIMNIVKLSILALFGYSISPSLEILSYIINFAIFVILTVCVL